MANDDTIQQLDEWKQKYYQSITALEKQQSYDDLLQRSLGRLALAAQGLDDDLDTQLKSLRHVLRSNSDQSKIQTILELMEQAIAKMDASVKKEQHFDDSGKILADLLTKLKLPRPYKRRSKELISQLSKADDAATSKIVPDVLALLTECLQTLPKKTTTGNLGFHLFGLGKSADQPKAENNKPSVTEIDNDITPHEVLIELLERLSLPEELSKQATKIRHQIEHGVSDLELPAVITTIADIVSSLGSQVITEKLEYETFLKTLTERLNELDQHIRQTSDQDIKAFEQRTQISKHVENEVQGLRNHVEDAGDLNQLKTTINQRLDILNDHFEKYRHADEQRLEQSQLQITQLTQRIKAIEQESDELRQLAALSREQALKDALTGIWNRQALDEVMEKEYARWLRYQSPLSIIIWDIDYFKKVNDNYGHAAGDKVLKTIAQIFKKATRDADFIARFGGEEFMGIFPETRLEEALSLANKIREKVANSKFHYDNKPVPITASAGLAMFRPNDSIDDVFKRADQALYRAKESGRNRCLVED
ncbi:MAG: diguanylate cyclase [Gammaproteobacteria bacterium]|nr:diguanylate cyclase [Gammaproteobacteria bacterium]